MKSVARLAAVVMLLILTGGPFLLARQLARDAYGDPGGPYWRNGAPIVVLSNDPAVTMNPSLLVTPDRWFLSVQAGTAAEREAGLVSTDTEALIVLAGDFRFKLDGESWESDEANLVEVWYQQAAAAPWLRGSDPLQLVRLQLKEGQPSSLLPDFPAISGVPDPPVHRRTAAGRQITIPPMQNWCGGAREMCSVNRELESTLKDSEEAWFLRGGRVNGAYESVEVRFGDDWQLGATNPPPDGRTDGPFGGFVWRDFSHPKSGSVLVELRSSSVASASQAKTLWAGVAFGVAASIFATAAFGAAQALWRLGGSYKTQGCDQQGRSLLVSSPSAAASPGVGLWRSSLVLLTLAVAVAVWRRVFRSLNFGCGTGKLTYRPQARRVRDSPAAGRLG